MSGLPDDWELRSTSMTQMRQIKPKGGMPDSGTEQAARGPGPLGLEAAFMGQEFECLEVPVAKGQRHNSTWAPTIA